MNFYAKSCCFTGHRPEGLPWGYQEDCMPYRQLRQKVKDIVLELYDDDYRNFYCGMALGADLMFAEIVLELKQIYEDINLIAVIPCLNQTAGWGDYHTKLYTQIVRQLPPQNIILIQREKSSGAFLKRNRYMVEHSDTTLAVFCGTSQRGGTYYTVMYTLKKNNRLIIVNPYDMDVR